MPPFNSSSRSSISKSSICFRSLTRSPRLRPPVLATDVQITDAAGRPVLRLLPSVFRSLKHYKKEKQMKRNAPRIMMVTALALMLTAGAAIAQTPEASVLPVTEPLDVGGTILQPGTYTIRVLPSMYDRNKIQVTSMDGTQVFATALTVPHPLEPGEEVPNTTFIFYPAGEGQPRALRTWFAKFPDASQGGHDIIYDKSRARQLARLASSNVVSFPSTVTV